MSKVKTCDFFMTFKFDLAKVSTSENCQGDFCYRNGDLKILRYQDFKTCSYFDRPIYFPNS
jgi:hypothetical protein